jgi:hypothetical protein
MQMNELIKEKSNESQIYEYEIGGERNKREEKQQRKRRRRRRRENWQPVETL